MKKDLLLVLTVESVVIGVVLGFIIRPLNPSNDAISLIGFPGEIFMQIVEMMILPLIISSVISALAQIRAVDAGRMGLLTVAYYMVTSTLSTFTGILLVSCIHPGDPLLIHELGEGTLDDTALSPMDTFLDQIRNMFPENIVQATFQQVQTNYVPVKPPRVPQRSIAVQVQSSALNLPEANISSVGNASSSIVVPMGSDFGAVAAIASVGGGTTTTTMTPLKPILEYTNEVNVLGLIVFCTGFGVILSVLGEQARLMINFFIVLDAVIMRWISALMWCYPIGILSLVCKNIVDIDNLTETAQALAMYVVTVICGLMIHSLLTLPLLYYVITRQSPFEFMTGMLQAIATAFGTASSGATLPVTFRALEQNLRIDRRVTRFVLPLGATITMDGTALYEAVAVIFIAQLHNIKLSPLELLTISITTTVASIGSGSVPAGLDTILIVLTTVGLPAKDLSLLLTVDWLLDRIRTSVNVLGDGFGCGIISHLTKERLIESDNIALIRKLKEDIELLNSPDHPTTMPPLPFAAHSAAPIGGDGSRGGGPSFSLQIPRTTQNRGRHAAACCLSNAAARPLLQKHPVATMAASRGTPSPNTRPNSLRLLPSVFTFPPTSPITPPAASESPKQQRKVGGRMPTTANASQQQHLVVGGKDGGGGGGEGLAPPTMPTTARERKQSALSTHSMDEKRSLLLEGSMEFIV